MDEKKEENVNSDELQKKAIYFNTNVQDAQKEYAQFMHKRQSVDDVKDAIPSVKMHDISLINYSRMLLSENMVSGLEIQETMEIEKFHKTGTLLHTIAQGERLFLSVQANFLWDTTVSGTDTGAGINMSYDYLSAVGGTVADNVRISLAHSMEKDMTKLIDQYNALLLNSSNGSQMLLKYGIDTSISGKRDLTQVLHGVNAMLQDQGLPTIRGIDGKLAYENAIYYLQRNGNKLTPEQREMIENIFCKAAKSKIMLGNHGRLTSIKRFSRKMTRRYLQQCDAGDGIYTIINFVYRAKVTLKYSLKAMFYTLKASKFIYLLMAKIAVLTGLANLANSLAHEIYNHVEDTILGKGIRAGKKVKQRVLSGVHKTSNQYSRFRRFVRDPFHLRRNMAQLGKRAGMFIYNWGMRHGLAIPLSIAGRTYNILHIITNAIGNVFAVIGTVVSFVVSAVLLLGLAFILGMLLASLILNMFIALLSLFDFNASDEEIRQAALEQIKTCYEEQNAEIMNLRSRYRSTSIIYNDIRDEDAYSEHEPEVRFEETTNSAEILSMAYVYFDFDFEKAGENKVKNYVKKLYNGSHETSVVEHSYSQTDSSGNVTTYTDAELTLTTYYFNSLFDCELASNYGVISGNNISEQVWNYFRSVGFSEESTAAIMANFYIESYLDPTCDAGAAAGICMFEKNTGFFNELVNYAASRGKQWTDLNCQLDLIMQHLPETFNTYSGRSVHYYDTGEWCWWPTKVTLNEFKKKTDIDEATEMFMRIFERPSITHLDRRLNYAHMYYSMYSGSEVLTD